MFATCRQNKSVQRVIGPWDCCLPMVRLLEPEISNIGYPLCKRIPSNLSSVTLKLAAGLGNSATRCEDQKSQRQASADPSAPL